MAEIRDGVRFSGLSKAEFQFVQRPGQSLHSIKIHAHLIPIWKQAFISTFIQCSKMPINKQVL